MTRPQPGQSQTSYIEFLQNRLAVYEQWKKDIENSGDKDGWGEVATLRLQVVELKRRLLSAAGDDLCRLTPEEIKAYTSGAVQIPPKEEFMASCDRFHTQIVGEVGVLGNCLTLAQLIAENQKLTDLLHRAKEEAVAAQDFDTAEFIVAQLKLMKS